MMTMKFWLYCRNTMLMQMEDGTAGDIILLGISVIMVGMLIRIFYLCAGALADILYRKRRK